MLLNGEAVGVHCSLAHTGPSRLQGDVLVDPGRVGGHSGVDPRVVDVPRGRTPAQHYNLDPHVQPVTDQGTPGITL